MKLVRQVVMMLLPDTIIECHLGLTKPAKDRSNVHCQWERKAWDFNPGAENVRDKKGISIGDLLGDFSLVRWV